MLVAKEQQTEQRIHNWACSAQPRTVLRSCGAAAPPGNNTTVTLTSPSAGARDRNWASSIPSSKRLRHLGRWTRAPRLSVLRRPRERFKTFARSATLPKLNAPPWCRRESASRPVHCARAKLMRHKRRTPCRRSKGHRRGWDSVINMARRASGGEATTIFGAGWLAVLLGRWLTFRNELPLQFHPSV
eukprot:3976178-Prymnesium_polylepis.2